MPTTCDQQTLVLASASPRRRQLLAAAGLASEVAVAGVDESPLAGESPAEHVRRLALAKARVVSTQYPSRFVLGADTVVVVDGEVFGKPTDTGDAYRMLRRLADRWHEVLTGVALVRCQPPCQHHWVCRTRVRFRPLPENTLREYCRRVNTLDKAGAYGIQEHGDMLVAEIDGLYTNVVGLPIEEVTAVLATLQSRGRGE
jgi:septum formation protein